MNTQLDNKLLKLCDLVPCICDGSSLLQALAAVLHKCHHMGDRAAKLRKLNAFRRKLPHCSASALGAILKEIKQHGVPEGATSRDAFRDARDLQNHTTTPFGAIVQTLAVSDKDDVDQQLTIAHPIALLWVASSECSSFSVFFLEKL